VAAKRAPDPGTVCRELCAAAAEGRLPRLLLLLPPARGEAEPWFPERILLAVRSAARAATDLEFLDLDGGDPDFDPAPLEGFLGAGSLFGGGGGRGLVLGRALRPLSRWGRLFPALLQAAADPGGPQWMVLDLASGSGAAALLKKHQKALKALGEAARVERFRRLYGDPPPWKPDPDASEAARFAAAEARGLGLRLGPGAAGALVAVAGSRPGEILQALRHLQLLGLERVEEEDVRAVAAHSAEGNAFAFAEAVLEGRGDEALRILQQLRARGLRTWDGRRLAPQEAFSLLVSVLAGERRRTAAVAAALQEGLDWAEAARRAGVPAGGPPAQRMQRRLERAGPRQLDRVLEALREAEVHLKREGWRQALHVLELLVLRCHRGRRSAAAGGGR